MEDRVVEINKAEQKKRIKRNEDSLTGLWENIKDNSIQIMGVPEEEAKRKVIRKYLKRLLKTENFPNM